MNNNKINKQFSEWNEPDDVNQEFRLLLDDYTVEYPNDEAIAQTIDVLRAYVKTPDKKRSPFFPLRLRQLHIRPVFWILNALFFSCGLLAWGVWEGDPYMIMLMVSPVPFILGLLEIFRGRDEGLLELEMSCEYSGQQLMLMKLTAVGVYNVLLCFVLIAIFSVFGEPLLLSKLVIYWATPLTVTASIGFALAWRVRGPVFAPVALVIWLFSASACISALDSKQKLDILYPMICGAISVLAITLLIVQIKRLRRGQFDEIIH